jgi:hypothetical protein
VEARVGWLDVRWLRWGLAAAAVPLLVSGPAAAQEARRIAMEVMVSHISDRPGEIDARASELDRKLRQEFRYKSLRVLQSRRLSLELDEVGSLKLPNGKYLRVRPLQVSDRGVLTAVSVEGTLETDLRIRNGHLVVIGAERHDDGKLVISLEPHF